MRILAVLAMTVALAGCILPPGGGYRGGFHDHGYHGGDFHGGGFHHR